MMQNTDRKVWLMGGYGPFGGNIVAYQLGLILHKHFDCKVTIVDAKEDRLAPHPLFPVEEHFEAVHIDQLPELVQPNDWLISQPSFSDHLLGYKLECNKLMYVQGFNTYRFLDTFFEHYVAVSPHVQTFLKEVYGVNAELISPFIVEENMPRPIPWEQKKDELFIYPKFNKDHFRTFLPAIRQALRKHKIPFQLFEGFKKINQKELLDTINQYKYFLTMAIGEGFGLVPLEAMYMGCVVAGFDGFGGRAYMQKDKNCVTVSYPEIEQIVPQLHKMVQNPIIAAQVSDNAQVTAGQYTYDVFEQKWIKLFEQLFAKHQA